MATSGVAASNHVVKAGWMQRQSDILKNWKRSYCVLKTNGVLTYYSSERLMDPQGNINLPRDIFALKIGPEVVGISPPHAHLAQALIEIRTCNATTIFCADSIDDAQMWKLVFDDVIRAHRQPRSSTALPAPGMVAVAPPPYAVAPPQPLPPPVYSFNAPAAQPVAPVPAPVTVIAPGTTSRVSSTTYYPNGQTVTTVRRGGASPYPIQQTVHTYPGQVVFTPGAGNVTTYQVPNQTTTTVYRYQTYY